MITYLAEYRQFQLDTPHASYVMTLADDGFLLHTYWGRRLPPQDLTDLLRLSDPPFVPSENERERASFMDCAPFEYPCAGTGDYREPALVTETPGGGRACDLRYVSHRIYNGKYSPRGLPHTWGNGCETLDILMRDEPTGLKVTLHYTVFAGIDAVIRSVSFENGGGRDLILQRTLSASLDMDDDRFEMISLYGSWARERQAERLPLRHGKQRLKSARGILTPVQPVFCTGAPRNDRGNRRSLRLYHDLFRQFSLAGGADAVLSDQSTDRHSAR